MSKSRARLLAELLNSSGLVKKSKSALSGADEVIDLSALPTITNAKLENASITIADHVTALGGSVTLNTGDIGEHTNYKYYTDARADARIAAADTGDLSEGSNLYFTNARADARIVNAGSANWNTAYGWGNHASAGYLTSYTDTNTHTHLDANDNRTIAPSEFNASDLYFGFTSWANNNTSPYADYLHMRSYSDSSGGADNMVMFKKSGIGMRLWQQTFGSSTNYSNYEDVWHTGNLTTTNKANYDTAYGWGNHASAGYVTSSGNTVIGTDTDLSFSGANVLSTIALTDGVITSYTNRVLTLANLGYTGETNATADQSAAEILTAIKTVDGSGSGLDADTIDGIDSSRIIYGSNASGTGEGTFTNWNSPTKSGFYSDDAASNKWSTANWSSIIHHKLYDDNNSYATQLGFDTYNNNLYTRTNSGGTWTSWDKIWHAGVDGAGSGLDADLLDGQHGSYYYSSANPPPTYSKYLRADVSDVYNGRVLSFGTAGNGTNTSGAFLTIEGNTDSSGEGSGRLFFREHNSSTAAADNYGMSLGYRGGATSVTTARGNTWTGLTAIGNGEWGMWGHDGDQTGVLAMHGPRTGSYVDFNNAKIAGNQVWHAGNDGSGSGLDADLLDGQHGSYYRAYANLTGTPTIPSLSGYATESYVGTQISNLVDSSPAALNTLNELAAAIGDDANFSTTVTNNIATKLPKAGGTMTGNLIIDYSGNATNDAGLYIANDNSDWGIYVNKDGTGTYGIKIAADGEYPFQITNSSGTEKFRVNNSGNVILAGTVDGRDVSADGTKLDTIATSANNYSFPYTVSASESNSTVVQRHPSGYIYANYYNGSGTFSTSGNASGMALFTGTNGSDTFGRPYTAAAARTLLNVENGATADQTAAEILTAIKTVDGSGSGLDADNLDGVTWASQTKAVAARNLTIEAGDGQGIGFWGGTGTVLGGSYAIAMSSQGNGNAGRMNFETTSDYNMYFKMSGGTNRGFVFKNGTSKVLNIDGSGHLRANSVISSNNRQAMNCVHWSASGTSTGAVKITLPGTYNTVHSMPIIKIYTYQYSSTAHVVYTISGHNWSTGSNWYNNRVTAEGGLPLAVRLGHDGTNYCIIIGETNTSWSYGSATVELKAHPSYYNANQNFTSGWTATQITSMPSTVTTQTVGKIWDSSSDGSGSGLDADLLDGQHGSYYAPATGGSYLPLAGGTITGNLNVNGTTTLGNGPSDQTHINDTLYLGATDSGDSHFYFGENSSNWYGDHWYWDSGHEVERYSRHAGTDTLIEKHHTQHTHKVQTNRAYERLGHSTGYQIGSYNSVAANSTKTNPIYTIGDSYRPSDTSVSGMYGIGYAHSNLWGTGSGKTSGWGQYVVEAGAYTQIFSVGGTWSLGEFNRNGNKVWDAGNDGSGSGLDADLLDGQHGSYYAPASSIPTVNNGTLSITTSGSVSGGGSFTANNAGNVTLNLTGNGIMQGTNAVGNGSFSDTIGAGFRFQRVTGGSNRAYGSHHNLLQIPNTSGDIYLAQMAFGTGDTKLAWRSKATAFGSWYDIWHSGNDGSGSGLDADLLDGQHGSYYAPASHVHSYLPINNPTATGTLISPIIRARKSQTQGNYTTAALWTESYSSTNTGIAFHISGNVGKMLDMRTDGHLYWENGRVWSATSDGSGSGLDADLLDGQQGSYYAPASHNHTGVYLPIGNKAADSNLLDGIDSTGFVRQLGDSSTGPNYLDPSSRRVNPNASNPTNNHYAVSTFGNFGNVSGQLATHFVSGAAYTRGYNSVWSAWRTQWDSLNDGAGSGLDADLLDGQQGSYYYSSANPPPTPTSITESHRVSGNAFATTGSPGSALEYQQASGQSDTKLAPSTDWHNSIRMGHGNPYSYYSNTIAMRMTGSGLGDLYTQTISNNSAQGWNKHWHTNNDGAGSGLDADLLDGQQGSYYYSSANPPPTYAKYLRSDASDTVGNGVTYTWASTNTEGLRFTNSSYAKSLYIGGWSGANTAGVSRIRNSNDNLHLDSGANGQIYLNNYNAQDVYVNGANKVWHAGNDSSGSGLDADLLDGQHGSYYAPASSIPSVGNGTLTINTSGAASGSGTFTANQSGNTTITISATNTTYNFGGSTFTSRNSGNAIAIDSVVDNMVGYVNSSTAAGYSDGAGFSAAYSSSWVGQLFVDFRTGKLSTRGKNNGTWQAHRFMWDNLNDGSGSGLDADLLDGQHASAFLTAETLSSTNSVTVTGTKYFKPAGTVTTPLSGGGNASLQAYSVGGNYAAYMAFHRSGHYAINWGLDTSNNMVLGGWSAHASIPSFKVVTSTRMAETGGQGVLWGAGNDGSGSGLDADLLDGLQLHTGRNNEANKVVRTDGNGYIQAGWINTTSGDSGIANDVSRIYCSSDGYLRYLGKSDFKVLMGLSKDTYDRRDYTTDTNYWTGTNAHGAYNMNDLFARGSGFIDVWGSPTGRPPSGSHFNGFQALHYSASNTYHHGMQMVMSAGNPSNTYLRGWWANGGSGYAWQKIWTDGNDGSGSGLDADLLDGQQGSYYYPASNPNGYITSADGGSAGSVSGITSNRIVYGGSARKSTQVSTFAGVNEVTGFYFGSGVSGAPTTDWINYMHAAGNSWSSSNNYSFQLTHAFHSDNLWVSRTTNGSQSTARKIWDSASDGAGSGLDADLLDGQQGSYYAPATGGSYLPLAGGTTSGTITLGTQYALVANNYGRGLFGVYSATRYQHVWSMGTAYKTSDDGTSYGNMYGLTYTHTNIGTGTNQSISGLSHQLQHRQNGVLNCAFGAGIWTSGNVTAYSDIAVKTNLVRIPNALEKVCSINGYTYERTDYIKDLEDPEAPDVLRQAGVVAQEIEKVLPEVVSGKDGNKAVAYGNIVALLIESIKELKDEVDELKKQLKER
jgi:hypothetical protein